MSRLNTPRFQPPESAKCSCPITIQCCLPVALNGLAPHFTCDNASGFERLKIIITQSSTAVSQMGSAGQETKLIGQVNMCQKGKGPLMNNQDTHI